MYAQEFFLEQFDTVRGFVYEYCLKGLTDEQLRYQPQCGSEGLNAIAWMIWHTARCQDWGNTLIDPGRRQVWNEDWMARSNIPRRDLGTGMTREECTEFNRAVNIGVLHDYWNAVAEDVRDVARGLPAEDLDKPVGLHEPRDPPQQCIIRIQFPPPLPPLARYLRGGLLTLPSWRATISHPQRRQKLIAAAKQLTSASVEAILLRLAG